MPLGRLVLILLTCALSHLISTSDSSLAKEVDDDVPMGTAGGTVRVDPFTGTATTSIPIQIFPGRNGIQPNLQLTYASGNGNGWVGMGWKLELGAIERNTRFGVIYNETATDNGKVYVMRLNGAGSDLLKLNPSNAADRSTGPKWKVAFSAFGRLRQADGKSPIARA